MLSQNQLSVMHMRLGLQDAPKSTLWYYMLPVSLDFCVADPWSRKRDTYALTPFIIQKDHCYFLVAPFGKTEAQPPLGYVPRFWLLDLVYIPESISSFSFPPQLTFALNPTKTFSPKIDVRKLWRSMMGYGIGHNACPHVHPFESDYTRAYVQNSSIVVTMILTTTQIRIHRGYGVLLFLLSLLKSSVNGIHVFLQTFVLLRARYKLSYSTVICFSPQLTSIPHVLPKVFKDIAMLSYPLSLMIRIQTRRLGCLLLFWKFVPSIYMSQEPQITSYMSSEPFIKHHSAI